MLLGGIEAGGTKWICALGTADGELLDIQSMPTGPPTSTLAAAQLFFRDRERPAAIGIASFGPLDLEPASPSFGRIKATPKAGWSNVDIAAPFRDGLGLPIRLESDVNAAALAELRLGAGQGKQNIVYITVGTGIGAGFIAGGGILRGKGHPEFGHTRVPHDNEADPFEGSCPYHRDCLEGLASGESIRRRWGERAESLQASAAWALEAHYLALAVTNLIYSHAPERIILGGGVMKHPGLLAMVRQGVANLLAGYGHYAPEGDERLEELITAPALGPIAGLHGGIELAKDLNATADRLEACA